MSHLNKYCYIDSTKNTNECEDPGYNRLYYNKDSEVYKLNYYSAPPSVVAGALHPKNTINPGDSLQNNIPGSVPDNLNNNGYPFTKIVNNLPSSVLTNNLNYTSNSATFNNSTLNYGHINHQNGDDTTLTNKN